MNNLFNLKCIAAGIGSYGSMILGAEQDFQEKSTLRKLDKFQYFEGSIANFNMWQVNTPFFGICIDNISRYL